ncbi:MAG: DUF3365 domain-containing protein [Magnetococcales bacterium]|nr:DUF3365 domain-containing protein [Magnetococcales bacterium]MBF0151407.1 DUF3365 domain-containing protein [Magnetococcales bacterium]MBF0348194.1 DUF3365 domain-containing protein [Magnetococcales bacterium]MBF0632307.1 DUF3365 domain-containing protein [Magnetococcales bacterium]
MSIIQRYLLTMVLAMLFIPGLTALLLGHLEKKRMEQEIDHRIELVARFAGATREYVAKNLRPALDQVAREFILEGKSSSYVTNGIFGYFNRHFPDYRYRQPALAPLNPTHLASPFERDLIKRFQENSALTVIKGYQKVDGRIYYYSAFPVVMEQKCLPCHGNPVDAPAALLNSYGTDSGFHWPVGKVISATVIQVPIDDEIAAMHARYYVLGGCALLLLSFFLGLHQFLFHRSFIRRLSLMTAIMDRQGGEGSVVERLPDEGADELGLLARSCNRTIQQLREANLELERKARRVAASEGSDVEFS